MAPKRTAVLWSAEPHTIAKITILKGYLHAWFPILGRTQERQDLLYVDGFAGPGRYENHPEGSPVAALIAAKEALTAVGSSWKAGDIHCAFIEEDPKVADHLAQHIESLRDHPRLKVHILRASFTNGIAQLQRQMPGQFTGGSPLLVFIDPFGATGVPFSIVQDILRSARSEVLINLDADAMVRIWKAGAAASHEVVLTRIFGDDSWREPLERARTFREKTMAVLDLYEAHLRGLPGVRYVYSFEMLTAKKRVGQVGYFLVFASQHRRGLVKMKEAMRRVSQEGSSQFSDARVQQASMFRYDRPEDYSDVLHRQFVGRGPVPYAEVDDFALLETPFVNPKRMLETLERAGRIVVQSTDPKRRRYTFKEGTIRSIEFVEGSLDG